MSSLHRLPAGQFSLLEARLSQLLADHMWHSVGHYPSPSERRSWDHSLPALAADLCDAGLHGVEMLLEYQLPFTNKRADVVLAGISAATGRPAYLVVELKQWTHAYQFEDSDVLVAVDGYSRPVSHPIDQVRGYCEYLQDFTAALADTPEALAGVAYLHNATEYGVADLLTRPGGQLGRMFTGQRRGEFREFLTAYFAPRSGAEAADILENSSLGPTRKLMELAAEEVQKRECFVLLDDQRDAYECVRHAVSSARRAHTKTAVIVTGGPGSGKSVIALSLMGELARQGRTVIHATGSQSFTQTLRKVAAKGSPRVRKTFQYFNSFMQAEPNDLEVLIMDEAHRIRETSVNQYTKASLRTGRPQIDELLCAARTPVFLLDQHQVVRPGELGTVDDIREAAAQRGIDVLVIELDDQFRCGGSQAYVRWVQRLLGLTGEETIPWEGDAAFDVQVMESPQELQAWLEARHDDNTTARMSAGFCWPWSDPRPDGSLVHDIQIGDWTRPWNLKSDRAVGGAPPKSLWATDPAGFGQVGCVYTAQGFEYDYAGVVLGPDLVRRAGRWETRRTESRDPAFRSRKSVTDEEVDRLIRNVYKVLLTRAMRGIGLYSTDPETQDFLRSIVP
ncbi:hypothetical protein KEM60_01065 [Austwickia sp. TVS 96-490-7B]|uniref:DUF2075 domain-containing protein n=1 Tax=Austwickia sp. TVS 96-490-7B TaxID=2830843 RepID=UPI001C55C2FD|nr:DUF2075 domain-containing protein [Austwickia sp. TVS 96-490-7B]MBW3084876.1 hypothetical protein [Austwickia sp. TVS 96-490-7B]